MPIVAHMPWPFPVVQNPRRWLFAVRVDAEGDRHIYEGIFPNAVDATTDALERFGPDAKVRVKPQREVTA